MGRLEPLSLSAILTVRAASSIAFSTAFGAWIDERTTLKPYHPRACLARRSATACSATRPIFCALTIIAALPVAIRAAAFSRSVALVERCSTGRAPTPSIGPLESCARAGRGSPGPSVPWWAHDGRSHRISRRLSRERRVGLGRSRGPRLRPFEGAFPRGGSSPPARPRPMAALTIGLGFRGSRPILHGHLSEPVRVSDRAHEVARRRDERRRDRDEPMHGRRDRCHGRDHLAPAEARRTHADQRRFRGFRCLLPHTHAREQRSRESSGRRFHEPAPSVSSPISESASSTR